MLNRQCPNCSNIISYKNKRCFNDATKLNNVCKSCSTKKMHSENPSKMSGKNNPMFGTSWKEVWKTTMSKEEFDFKIEKLKSQKSIQNSGINNPMFGKPSPNGSGRGRGGIWKGTHFRSLLELAFLEKYFKEHNQLPLSAERKEKSIKLKSGKTYFPDFEGHNEIIYEIKPSRMIPLNIEKIEAGLNHYGKKFKIVTEKELPNYNNIHLRLNEFIDLKMHKE